jgi:hypothetical protein
MARLHHIAKLYETWIYLPLWIVVIIMHYMMYKFVSKIHFTWKYAKRLQDICGNDAMESETVRHIMLHFASDARNGEKYAIMGVALLALLLSIVPMALTFVMLIKSVLQNAVFFMGIELNFMRGLEFGTPLMTMGVLGMTVLTSMLVFFFTLAGWKKDSTPLLEKIFRDNPYKTHSKTIQDLLISQLQTCKGAEGSNKSCKGSRLFSNISQNILEKDMLESLEAAQTQLQKWVDDKRGDIILRYVKLSQYGRNLVSRMSDYDALRRIQDNNSKVAIAYLASLANSDPSPRVEGVVRAAKLFLGIIIATIAYLAFHNAYAALDATTMMMAVIMLFIIMLMVGYVKVYFV